MIWNEMLAHSSFDQQEVIGFVALVCYAPKP